MEGCRDKGGKGQNGGYQFLYCFGRRSCPQGLRCAVQPARSSVRDLKLAHVRLRPADVYSTSTIPRTSDLFLIFNQRRDASRIH
jgi:hypothetical protein